MKKFRLNRKVLKKVVVITSLVTLFILMTLTILFQINKDKIASTLLLKVNEYQNGELDFDDLSFNPFIHFPNVSIVLYEIQYYEEKRALPEADTIPILSLGKLYIDINLIDLLKGEVKVPNIYLEHGSLNLLSDKNGLLNLIKALKKNKVVTAPVTKQKKKVATPDSLKQEKSKPKKKVADKNVREPTPPLIVDLENVYLSDIDVTYINYKEKISSHYQLQSLQASLQYSPDTIICALDTKLLIVDAYIANSYRVDSIQVGLNTRLNLDNKFESIRIEPSQLEIDEASFLAEGTLGLDGDGAIDMVIKGNDSDFGILNLVFTNIGIDNIEKGEMYFDAFIKGSLFNEIPNIKGTFGIDDLQVNIPSTSQKVSDLTMRVSFNSGDLDRLEGANFQIEKISAKLPQGKLQGQLTFKNFLTPQLDVDFFVKSEISGFDKLIKVGDLEKMTGIFELKTKFKGQFNRETKVWNKQEDYSHIIFKDVSLSKSETKNIDAINGKISLQRDELKIDSVKLVIGESALLLNGSVSNLKLLIAKLSSDKAKFNSLGGIYVPLDTLHPSQMDVDLILNTNLSDLIPFMPENSLDSLGGSIELKSHYSGPIEWEEDVLEFISGQSSISFDQVAVDIPRINKLRNIDGNLLLSNSVIFFNNLHVDYGKSDALIKGTLSNLPYLLLDVDKPIEGKLSIKSSVFDYPDFFSWDSFIASAFPYRIKNINLVVAPKSTTKDLLHFIQTPRLEFVISKLDAEIEDFLPPVSISRGSFVLSDKDGGVNLDFDDFKIKVLDGNVRAHVDIQTSRKNPNWLNVEANLGNVNLKETFTHWGDSIPAYFDGILDGQANVSMTFGDSKVKFDKVDVTSSTLVFKSEKDTIRVQGLVIAAKGVDYQPSSGFLETMSFTSDVYIDDFKIKKLESDSLQYDIIAHQGEFTVVPTDRNFLKEQGEGKYTFKPFNDPPEFDFKYKIDHFDIVDLLKNFREDPMIDGQMKLDLQLKSAGKNQVELLQNLNGYISLYGNDLSLQGVDLNKLIERFKRSQRFTFADLGAVALMGPFGLLVSKGSDYAGMVVVDRDHVSKVYELSSDYTFENGRVTFEDVALSTELNRLAASGTIDMQKDSLNISFALLNKDGCSIFSQNITGSIIDPAMGKVNAGKIILAPITNLAKKTVGTDCDIYYNGKVKQPVKKSK
jgi:AsmA-like C-terminal region/AsmA family